MYVPIIFLGPHLDGSSHEDFTELLDLLGGLDLQGKAGLPLGHLAALFGDGEEHGVRAVKSADGALTDSLVRVLRKGQDNLDGLLKVRQISGLGVGNKVTDDLNGDLLLERDGSGGGDVVPGIFVLIDVDILDLAVLANRLIIVISAGDLDLAASNGHFLADEVLGSLTERNFEVVLILLNAIEQALDNAIEEGGEVLGINLRHSTPEDVGALLQAGVAKVKSLLGGTHERLNVRLVALGAGGGGHLTHSISDASAEVKLLLAVLDSSELLEEVHGLIEEGQEGVSGRGGKRSQGSGGETLDSKVGVLEELVEDRDQLTLVGSNVLLVQTVDNSVDGADTGLHDVDGGTILFALVLLHGTREVVEQKRHEFLVLLAKILGKIIGETSDGVQRGLAHLRLGIGQKLQDHREDFLHLSADEVGSALHTHAKSHDTGAAVVRVAVAEVLSQGLEKRNDNLAGGQALSEHVEETQGRAGRGDIVVGRGCVTELSDDVESGAGELLTKAHTLDLQLAILDALHQEADSLGTGILVGIGVGGNLIHEDDQILKVHGHQGRVTTQEGLEDLEALHDAVLVTLIDGLLQNSDHGGQDLLESLDGSHVLLRVEVHAELAQREEGVDTDLFALGVADGLAEQIEQVLVLLLQTLAERLQNREENVDGNTTLVLVSAVAGLEQQVGQFGPLAIVQVDLGDGRDHTSDGVTDKVGRLAHGSTEQLLADLRLLTGLDGNPVLVDKGPSLDGGELSEVGIFVSGSDLDEKDQGLGLVVELALENAGGLLDVTLGSYRDAVSMECDRQGRKGTHG